MDLSIIKHNITQLNLSGNCNETKDNTLNFESTQRLLNHSSIAIWFSNEPLSCTKSILNILVLTVQETEWNKTIFFISCS